MPLLRLTGPTDASFTVSATVSSQLGSAVTDEVPQLYGAFLAPSSGLASYPLQQLLNFTRLKGLAPGSASRVSFVVPRDALTLMSPSGEMRVAAGTWQLWVGGGPPSNAAYAGGGAVLSATLAVL